MTKGGMAGATPANPSPRLPQAGSFSKVTPDAALRASPGAPPASLGEGVAWLHPYKGSPARELPWPGFVTHLSEKLSVFFSRRRRITSKWGSGT